MKKVYFDRQDSLGNKILVLIMVVFLIIYLVTMLGSLGEKINGLSGVIGFGASVIFFGKQFVFRYYLGWNKKGFIIKINSFLTKSYASRDVKIIFIEEDHLVIRLKNESQNTFDVSNINPDDLKRIINILEQYPYELNSNE